MAGGKQAKHACRKAQSKWLKINATSDDLGKASKNPRGRETNTKSNQKTQEAQKRGEKWDKKNKKWIFKPCHTW